MKMAKLVFASAAFTLAAILGQPQAEAKEVRIVIGVAGDGALQGGMHQFAKKIEEKSGGEYTGKVFEGSLLNYAETSKGLTTGVAEVGFMVPAYERGEFPLTNYGIDIVATIVDPMAVGIALTEFIFTCEPCLEEFRRQNQVFLGFSVVGPYYFMATKAVNGLDDIKGMPIRGFSSFNKLVAKWGATAVSVPVSEVYQSMASGQMVGNFHLWDVIKTFSLGDHVEHVYDEPVGLYAGNSMFNTNLDFWKTLSAENKRNFMSSAAEALAWTTVTYIANDRELATNAEALKVKASETPGSIRQSIVEFRQNNIEDVIVAAEKDAAIPDARAMADRLIALVSKWQGLLKDVNQNDPAAVGELYKNQLFDKIDLAKFE